MPGVTIGNGAVIGANSVVTRDVAPYTIVAGAPAQELRRRFSKGISERIERLAWWDWSEDRLFDATPDMQAMTIEAFLDRWERR
jgi:carbonic anhydrase/acetyltransferase-like protein (isoleucine patch superfamily)